MTERLHKRRHLGMNEGRNEETSDDGLFGSMSLSYSFLQQFLLEAHVLRLAPSLSHLLFEPPVL